MPLFRIKEAHRPYLTRGGRMRIGGVLFGLAAEVESERQWVWHLALAMDGTRTRDALVAAVRARDPDVTATDVDDAITALREAGFVEDAAAEPPPELTARDRERYGRGVDLYRWMDLSARSNAWEIQARLRHASVLLVGVGGTGGGVAEGLVASGVGHLHCVDPDVVELSNLNRQMLYARRTSAARRWTPPSRGCARSTRTSRSPASGAGWRARRTSPRCCGAAITTCSCSVPTSRSGCAVP